MKKGIATLVLLLFMSIFLPPPASSFSLDRQEIKELMNKIKQEKFDLVLPQLMKKYQIDMWIQVMREGNIDPLSGNLGSDAGVFVFTLRGDRVERAVLGYCREEVKESGAYDLIITPKFEIPLTHFPEYRYPLIEFYKLGGVEWPGGPKTELDFRFKGLGKFVAERDPHRIALNYLEKLGSPVLYEEPRLRCDGISYTDYRLLVKEIGEKYAQRIVSAEYLITEFLARRVKSEIALFKLMRKWIDENLKKDFNRIIPGQTKLQDIESVRFVVGKNGQHKRDDDIFEPGDLICLQGGCQSGCFLEPQRWPFGNHYDVCFEYGYILPPGETEVPPKIKRAWADALKVRKIIENHTKSGRTAGETFEILKKEINKAGYIYINRQIFNPKLDPQKTQVPLDMHAAGAGIYAPRLGPLGPDWQRAMELPPNHHFYFEYWVFVPMPEWGEGEYLSLQFHDGALATPEGVKYYFPPPLKIHLIQAK